MGKNASKDAGGVDAKLCALVEFLSAENFLEPMLDKLHEFLGNPLMYTDHTHRLVFQRADNPPVPIEWKSVIELGHYDSAFMDERFYAIMERLTAGNGPLLLEQAGLDCLIQPAAFSGTYYGAVAALAQEKPFGEADARLLELAAKIIAVRGQSGLNLERRQEFLYSRIATDLLDGTIKTEKELLLRMKTRNWAQKPYNRVVFIKTDKRQSAFAQYIETNLLKAGLGGKVFTYLGNVILLEGFEIRPPDILAPALEAFLEQSKLASGVSDVFDRMLDLPKFYQQARRAVEYGDGAEGGSYVSYYDNYKLFDFVRECREKVDFDSYMHATVLYLAEYDKVNHSDLGKTLCAYLSSNRSIAHTAEAMHLHKNTITYRINKIKEVSGLDFSDTMDIFHVLLSYLLNEGR